MPKLTEEQIATYKKVAQQFVANRIELVPLMQMVGHLMLVEGFTENQVFEFVYDSAVSLLQDIVGLMTPESQEVFRQQLLLRFSETKQAN